MVVKLLGAVEKGGDLAARGKKVPVQRIFCTMEAEVGTESPGDISSNVVILKKDMN